MTPITLLRNKQRDHRRRSSSSAYAISSHIRISPTGNGQSRFTLRIRRGNTAYARIGLVGHKTG